VISAEAFPESKHPVGDRLNSQTLTNSIVFFIASFVILFFGMHPYPLPYDEGLVLTAAMRVAAGQVPHRDFYAIYGPADFYIPAALFKIFGQSVLIVRLLNLFIESLIVAAMYRFASLYCRRLMAVGAALVTFLWIYGLNIYISSAVFPVAFLSLISSMLLVPLFVAALTRKRLCLAGAIAGLSALYRYDTGVALLAVQVCIIGIASFVRPHPPTRRVFLAASALWPYLLGFAILTVPPAIYFLSVSAVYPLVLDVVILQAKNYQRGRHLPFPGIHLKKLDDLAVYIPIIAVGLSLFVLLTRGLGRDSDQPEHVQEPSGRTEKYGLLISLSLLAFVMFFKGYVRVGTLNMFVSLLPSLLLTAVLFESRMNLPRFVRMAVTGLAAFFIFTALISAAKATRHLLLEGSVPGTIAKELSVFHRHLTDVETTWCHASNPVTRGFCFLADDGRIRTIEFIDGHTRPEQPIFVGLNRHDKSYANDNLIYFGSQRLPATKWSHFDPGLQNSNSVQQDMVRELNETSPPYIVLDSEFESMNEPNDSSKSSGNTLLDDFIRKKYRYVQTFNEMSIWQLAPEGNAR